MHPGIISSPRLSRREFLLLSGSAAAVSLLSPTLHGGTAFATTWSGSTTTKVGGISYTYRSGLDGGARPKATTTISASQSVPAGRMQAMAILVRDLDKNVLASSGWKVNAAGSSVSTNVSLSSSALGVRSKGKVKVGNTVYFCNSTSPISIKEPVAPKNRSGLAYGTYAQAEAGIELDLLAVVADSGLEGYVLYEQFVDENAPDQIPVYDVEGETVIGTFTFGDK